jgi:C-terminal processing protease CtpA/Prc
MAWPPFIAMYPLFGNANKARWVDRDGKTIPFVDRAALAAMAAQHVGDRANPFASFATGPLAVLVGAKTASAGEMLLVALMGEERVRTFGQTSYGMSTVNQMHPLPDGSTLLLTQMRYALGDGPVFHGGIAPMQPAAAGETWDVTVRAAAEWAAANSPRCAQEHAGTE